MNKNYLLINKNLSLFFFLTELDPTHYFGSCTKIIIPNLHFCLEYGNLYVISMVKYSKATVGHSDHVKHVLAL